jgi:hypothetical protein
MAPDYVNFFTMLSRLVVVLGVGRAAAVVPPILPRASILARDAKTRSAAAVLP